ncbi:MAG: hypothetical protein OSB69_00745 [Alphaproteobacteria bacterium]|nr:hypothetical protein [Alphaproteobacteria bacterium]
MTPAKALPHANLAEGLAELQREVEALNHIEKAIELNPSSAQLRLNSAFTLLALGRYRDGWTAYEARLAPEIPDSPQRALDMPRWDGESLDKKHILVCSGQGTGDQLFFGAYLPGLVNRAAGATVETDPRLVQLFQRSLPTARVRPFSRRVAGLKPILTYGWVPRGEDAPDCYIDIACLPLLSGDTHENPVAPGRFLVPDPGVVKAWRGAAREFVRRPAGGRVVLAQRIDHSGAREILSDHRAMGAIAHLG